MIKFELYFCNPEALYEKPGIETCQTYLVIYYKNSIAQIINAFTFNVELELIIKNLRRGKIPTSPFRIFYTEPDIEKMISIIGRKATLEHMLQENSKSFEQKMKEIEEYKHVMFTEKDIIDMRKVTMR